MILNPFFFSFPQKDAFKADSKGEPFVVVRRGQASLNRGSPGPGKFSSMDKKLNGRSFRIISSDSDRTTTFGRNPAREKDGDLIDTGHRKLRADALKAPVAPGPGNLGMRTEHGGLTDEVKQFQLRLQDENLDVGIVMKERPCEASLKAFLASIIGRGDVDNVSAFGDSSQDVWEGASPDVSSRPGSAPSVHSGKMNHKIQNSHLRTCPYSYYNKDTEFTPMYLSVFLL